MKAKVKLPVLGSVKLAFLWSLYIVRKHWRLVAIYVLVGCAPASQWTLMHPKLPSSAGGGMPLNLTYAVGGSMPAGHPTVSWRVFQPISSGLFVLIVLIGLLMWMALIVLALITHNEVLRGPAGLNAETLGKGIGRVLGYALDFIRIWLVTVLAMLLVFAGIAAILALAYRLELPDWVFFAVFQGVFWLAFAAIQSRLLLRLPARALGQVMPWREVQRMGRGNTWRLVAASTLIYILLMLPATLVTEAILWAYVPGFPLMPSPLAMVPSLFELPIAAHVLLALLNSVLVTLQIVFVCAFLSVVYSELLPVLDEPDPNLPPMA
jgi:hypothetical protein